MRIVFIGSVIFSARALEKLLSLGAEIVGVVTKSESAFNSDFRDLSPIAEEHGIPVLYADNVNSQENVDWIESLQPEVIFCFGWSYLIKKQVLDIAPMGVVGYHPAMLPYNRGRHPIIWAKVLGLSSTGSTFFFMDEGADTGDILSQKEVIIEFNDDAGHIYEKLTQTALQQIEDFHAELKDKTFKRIPQDKNKGNTWRKRGMKDGEINFVMQTVSICNLVRALTHPYVGAHLVYQEKPIKVWSVRPGNYSKGNIEPGKVLTVDNTQIEIKTADSSVWLEEHEFENLPKVGSYIL